MIAKNIDEVIEYLEQIIQSSKNEENTFGYFAALYQKVTINIKEKLGQNYFDDDKRMEELDVIFANRYLHAYSNMIEGKNVTGSWKAAFDSSADRNLIVLQHLLFGMNAHINLDLGIAAASISERSNIRSLQADFNRINEVLGSLIDEVQRDLSKIWPTLLVILKWFKKVDNFMVNFGMTVARDGAWKFANELVTEDNNTEKEKLISVRDTNVSALSDLITGKGIVTKIIFKIIRIGERGSPSDKIEALKKVIRK